MESTLKGDVVKERHLQVLQLRAEGLSRKEIARTLIISPHTVADHSKEIQRELGAKNPAHAIAIGFRRGLIR